MRNTGPQECAIVSVWLEFEVSIKDIQLDLSMLDNGEKLHAQLFVLLKLSEVLIHQSVGHGMALSWSHRSLASKYNSKVHQPILLRSAKAGYCATRQALVILPSEVAWHAK